VRDNGEVTRLLRQWSAGDQGASEEVLQLTYGKLRTIAGACMQRERPGHTMQPTALVNELYLRLADGQHSEWNDRGHFYSFCARMMRWILSDHAKSRLREKRRFDMHIPFTEDLPWLGSRDSDAVDLDLGLDKLQRLDERKAKVLELRIYLGCTADETAEILHMSKATVDRDLTMARAWLCRELRGDVLEAK
jgi:RNA polymerase sigma factor (TIGR02999 family)